MCPVPVVGWVCRYRAVPRERMFVAFDQQLGLVFGPFTMGQILCLIMAIGGVMLLIKQHKFNLDRRL